jgi:hypothetical protein
MHTQQKTIKNQVQTISNGQSELQTMMQMMQQLSNIVPLVHQMAHNSGIINNDTQSPPLPTPPRTEPNNSANDSPSQNPLDPAGTNPVTCGTTP